MTKASEGPVKAAGYVRVSSKEQVEGESLTTQRQSITDYIKQQGWRLTEIYADEGISGGSVKERHALLRCLNDGIDGKFNVLVIHRLSRFGRNARELLNNHDELEKAGIQLRSISEGIDFGKRYGKAMLGMFAVMAELERDIIRETMLENRIAKGRKGFPTAGALPIGRTFDKETGEWYLNEEMVRLLHQAADEYLEGGSLRAIANRYKARQPDFPCYERLVKVLANSCGDTWTVKFENEEPITYTVPRILDEDTIRRVRERLEFNRSSRVGGRRYALQGFLHCEACGLRLSGQTQVHDNGREFAYYRHPLHVKCKAFNSISLKPIEDAVFRTIFENTADAPAFEKAIAESLPDERSMENLREKIKAGEKELKRIGKELDDLIGLALGKTLKKETIQSREAALLAAKASASEELEENRAKAP